MQNNKDLLALSAADAEALGTGQLKKTGEEYTLVSLSDKNIDQILALEDVAFAGLAAGEEAYLLRKDRNFFENHFAAGGDVLGVVHNGHLIAQSIIVNPTAAHPKTGMALQTAAPLESLTVLQGVIVDPAYQGNNLMGVMVEAWLAAAQKNGRTEALAEVLPGNAYSWSVFLQKGLHLESIGVDPADNAEVYNMHGHIPSLGRVFKKSAKKTVCCPQHDIAAQKQLFTAGYKGASFDRANDNLEFRRLRKKKHCL
jgi:hypothetical protein